LLLSESREDSGVPEVAIFKMATDRRHGGVTKVLFTGSNQKYNDDPRE
jgi:hypothetical protein